jgi:glyoxylase-like metal-dependent hydrolase (beta-lactamase superfamily II)
MAEWLRRGLQILARRFDSGSGLHLQQRILLPSLGIALLRCHMTIMEAPPPARQLSPLVRCLTAPNPSPFTYEGTQTFIVGKTELAIIDPGPDLPEHVDAILGVVAGRLVTAILCTHTHRDHSPAAQALKEATGAPIIGCAPLTMGDEGPRADAAFDPDYTPDHVLSGGEALAGEAWTLEAVATPGHTSNHLCFALPEEQALFTGDHVMGWSTTIVSPPDGDMSAYMQSLRRLLARNDRLYYPGHGPTVERPHELVQRLIDHRRQREGEIVQQLRQGAGRVAQMVPHIYKDVDPGLHPAAGRSVLAHLLDLEHRGLVTRDGEEWMLQ